MLPLLLLLLLLLLRCLYTGGDLKFALVAVVASTDALICFVYKYSKEYLKAYF